MRKQYLLILLLHALCCTALRAQSNYYVAAPKVFSGGLTIGPNFTQVDGDTYYGYHKVGLNAGAVVYVHFSEIFGVSMELDYSQKGSRGEGITSSPATGMYVAKYFMNLNYAEVPVTFHAIVHQTDIEAGLSYARLITTKEWVLAAQPVAIDPVANRFNTTDLNYIVGISHQVYKNLYANARFQYSAIAIRPPERVPAGYGYGNTGQYNNMLNLRLLYFF